MDRSPIDALLSEARSLNKVTEWRIAEAKRRSGHAKGTSRHCDERVRHVKDVLGRAGFGESPSR